MKESHRAFIDDIKNWGKKAVQRIARLTKKHGVLCSSRCYSNKRKG